MEQLPNGHSGGLQLPLLDLSQFGVGSIFLFDPSRVFLRLEYFGEYDNTIAGTHAIVICYRGKDPKNIKRICKFGFSIEGKKLIGTQFQGIQNAKAKEFFKSVDLPAFMKSYAMLFSKENGLEYSFKPSMEGIESATESARERLKKFLQ